MITPVSRLTALMLGQMLESPTFSSNLGKSLYFPRNDCLKAVFQNFNLNLTSKIVRIVEASITALTAIFRCIVVPSGQKVQSRAVFTSFEGEIEIL